MSKSAIDEVRVDSPTISEAIRSYKANAIAIKILQEKQARLRVELDAYTRDKVIGINKQVNDPDEDDVQSVKLVAWDGSTILATLTKCAVKLTEVNAKMLGLFLDRKPKDVIDKVAVVGVEVDSSMTRGVYDAYVTAINDTTSMLRLSGALPADSVPIKMTYELAYVPKPSVMRSILRAPTVSHLVLHKLLNIGVTLKTDVAEAKTNDRLTATVVA